MTLLPGEGIVSKSSLLLCREVQGEGDLVKRGAVEGKQP